MIENERQYDITRAQIRKLETALNKLKAGAVGVNAHFILRRAQETGLASQLEDLRAEVAEYEALRSGSTTVLQMRALEELPETLIRARVAAGLTQRGLAQLLGLKEQQVQRYEASRYAGASLSRVIEVARALGLRFTAPLLFAVRDMRGAYEVGARTGPATRAAEAGPGWVLESPTAEGKSSGPKAR